MTPASDRDAIAAQRAIALFFARLRPGQWPVAVSESMASIRRFDPSLSVSDGDLALLVTNYAVEHGHNLYFDSRRPPRGMEASPSVSLPRSSFG